jgi:hypothetical protein
VVENNIQNISAALQKLEKTRNKAMNIVDPQIQGRLKDIDFSSVQGRITDELGTLRKLKRRFSRDTLNIGVIGRARQGKSRLLQTLSGLSKIEIPDGSGGHCTGVRSTIYHNPDVPPYADVWFYSERAFLDEVIALYYDDLGLGLLPRTISDFKNNPLPVLPPDKQKLAQDQEKYRHLQKYQNKFSEYGHLLHANSPQRITHAQIREYVAQDTLDGSGEFFKFLAVREVRIVCRFALAHVGQIALIDMPGLGDTGVGDQERLVKTLEEDVDIILFVKRPGHLGANWEDVDIQLYDVAQRALNKIPLERWSFMVLNKVEIDPKSSNAHNCRSLRDKLNTTAIKVAQCIITDCSKSSEVNNNLLGTSVLPYMSANITALDQQYAKTCQESLDILHNEINAVLEKARDVWRGPGSSHQSSKAFDDEFDRVWDVIQSSLEKLKRGFQVKRDQKDQNGAQKAFGLFLDKALADCQSIKLPSLEEIEFTRDTDGKGSYANAYGIHLNEIRTKMISHLSSLDKALKVSIAATKNEVANVLRQDGRLERLTSAMGVAFLKYIYEEIPEQDAEYAKLKEAFGNFYLFEIRFRGFLLYRIREEIRLLEPDEAVSVTIARPKQIQELLESARDETVWKLKSIRKWVGDLDRVAFALVEEFVDQAIRAKKIEKEWKLFYMERQMKIWPNKFTIFPKLAALRNEWEKGLEDVSKANHPNLLRLTN